MADPTINIFDPTSMGWLGAGQGAASSLTGVAPVAALAGAGIGALLSPKHRWRGAAIGGGLGLAGGVGVPALLGAYELNQSTQKLLDQSVEDTHRRLMFPEADVSNPAPAPAYADSGLQKAVYEQARPLVSGDNKRFFDADDPHSNSSLWGGPTNAEARIGMAQKDVLRTLFKQHGGMTAEQLQDPDTALPALQEKVITSAVPELTGKGRMLAAALANSYMR